MENVILTVHLILALLLIGIVLLQRSEGGGLGMGGGSGGGGVMTGRQAANALSRLTWILAAGFLVTSVSLTLIATGNVSGSSVLDQLGVSNSGGSDTSGSSPSALPDYTPPPGVGEPIAPPAPEALTPKATGDAEASPTPADNPAAGTTPVTPPSAN